MRLWIHKRHPISPTYWASYGLFFVKILEKKSTALYRHCTVYGIWLHLYDLQHLCGKWDGIRQLHEVRSHVIQYDQHRKCRINGRSIAASFVYKHGEHHHGSLEKKKKKKTWITPMAYFLLVYLLGNLQRKLAPTFIETTFSNSYSVEWSLRYRTFNRLHFKSCNHISFGFARNQWLQCFDVGPKSLQYHRPWFQMHFLDRYYRDVIMSTMASQMTGVSIVYSTVCSGAHKRNIKAPRHGVLSKGQ